MLALLLLGMPNTDLAGAEWLLSRLHSEKPINWSSGVAGWRGHQTLADVIAEADGRLDRAKARRASQPDQG